MAEFKKRDANHDGIVTEKEAIAYGRAHGVANQIMLEADKNHDGYLSRAEVKAYYASREGPPRVTIGLRNGIELLNQTRKDRIPHVVPIRYGQMRQSPIISDSVV
jgi:hypothetical protein